MTDISDIVSYYSDLLIIQYHDKPKAKAHIELLVNELLSSGILFDIRDAFNIDTAIGVQLDILGKYVDLDRFYKGQTLKGFFCFTNYNEFVLDPTKVGFTNYSVGFNSKGRTLTYNDYLSNNQTLNDDDFRFLIKFRIIQNNINHSVASIDNAIYEFFGTQLFPDSAGNMAMYYFVQGIIPARILVAFQKKLLPKPIGVRLAYLIQQLRPFFALASYKYGIAPGITGFTNYSLGFTNSGETLDYAKAITG